MSMLSAFSEFRSGFGIACQVIQDCLFGGYPVPADLSPPQIPSPDK